MWGKWAVPAIASILIVGILILGGISSSVDVLGALDKTIEELCSIKGSLMVILCTAIDALTAENVALNQQLADLQDDVDGDGLGPDNCPTIANPNQEDIDGDGIGDVCDSDRDGDGIDNASDNCPDIENPNQEDTDGDGIGDACDVDNDNDGVLNVVDSCPTVPGTSTVDRLGCPDIDGDGVSDLGDNCPSTANTDQLDTDGDGIGDACEGGLDIVTTNEVSNNISVLLGTGTGAFDVATNFAVGTQPFSVAVGDFN